MKVLHFSSPGPAEVLALTDWPDPKIGPGEVLIRVHASGLNNADLLQRRGLYPAPKGESEILGLEIAGEVLEVGSPLANGSTASLWKPGDRVMALLSGGGYAEKAVVASGLLMPLPPRLSFVEGACIPEAFLTAFLELVWLGRIQAGEKILIHAGASGVGTAAIQLAKRRGLSVGVTASSAEKLEFCRQLGADALICYRSEEFSSKVLEWTGGQGVDVILDLVGAPYFEQNLACVKTGGRILLVGLSGGAKAEVNFRSLLNKRVTVMGSTLRARSLEERVHLTQDFIKEELPNFGGALKPILCKEFPAQAAIEAHRFLESQKNIGKVVLSWGAHAEGGG